MTGPRAARRSASAQFSSAIQNTTKGVAAPKRAFAMASGVALFVRSQFSKSTSKLEKIYIDELGLRDGQRDKGGPSSLDLPPEQRPS